jgi:carbon storage regulator
VLVLSRKCEQSLLVGDDITITVLSIDGERVKLGIDAPRSIPVVRSEVIEQMRSANASAAHPLDRSTLHTVAVAMRNRGLPAATGS